MRICVVVVVVMMMTDIDSIIPNVPDFHELVDLFVFFLCVVRRAANYRKNKTHFHFDYVFGFGQIEF